MKTFETQRNGDSRGIWFLIRDSSVYSFPPCGKVFAFFIHRRAFWPEGVFERLQSFLLQVYITKIVVHKADEPNAVFYLFDTE